MRYELINNKWEGGDTIRTYKEIISRNQIVALCCDSRSRVRTWYALHHLRQLVVLRAHNNQWLLHGRLPQSKFDQLWRAFSPTHILDMLEKRRQRSWHSRSGTCVIVDVRVSSPALALIKRTDSNALIKVSEPINGGSFEFCNARRRDLKWNDLSAWVRTAFCNAVIMSLPTYLIAPLNPSSLFSSPLLSNV
jgi:hypothetical protein